MNKKFVVPQAMYGNLYGNYRNRKFTDLWEQADDFINDYTDCGVPTTIKEETAITLYYLLYARYGNSTIASADENQFKYKVFATIFQYGPTWEKRLEVQKELREMSIEELQTSAMAVYNHSMNPSTAPKNDDWELLPTVNDQNVTRHKRSKIDAYALLTSLLQTDVTNEFLTKFKPLFMTVVSPELPLWYITGEIEYNPQGDSNDD